MLSTTQLGLDVIEFMPGKKASVTTLKALLPDIETALFFGKALDMDYKQLSALLYTLFQCSVVNALNAGDHSHDLQGYIVDVIPDLEYGQTVSVTYADIPHAEFLPEVWESIELQIASSLKEVATKLSGVIDSLPSKEGSMTFSHMAKMNRQRPTFGDFRSVISHQRVTDNLVVLDVSGSMTEHTVRSIIDDVVALSWKANASLAIVSNTTKLWGPGTYNSNAVLAEAEFGGTHYESLRDLFMTRNWGTVVTIADYDSSYSAMDWTKQATGRIGQVLDISLVNRPTFLAEVLGQLADEVKPLLVATGSYVLHS